MEHTTEVKTRLEKIKEFLNTLSCEGVDLQYYADESHQNAEDLRESIEDGGGFDEEIIYYTTAMEFLLKNDSSLRESLEIADEMGYEPKNLSSEILASLLASKYNREAFSEIEDEINEFFEQLNEEEEN